MQRNRWVNGLYFVIIIIQMGWGSPKNKVHILDKVIKFYIRIHEISIKASAEKSP